MLSALVRNRTDKNVRARVSISLKTAVWNFSRLTLRP